MSLNESDFTKKLQVVVSDSAPNTTGVKSIDSGKSLVLSEKAFELAQKFLAPQGNLVFKIFEGEGSDDLYQRAGKCFKIVKKFRPQSVFRGSREFYIIAKNFSPEKKFGK